MRVSMITCIDTARKCWFYCPLMITNRMAASDYKKLRLVSQAPVEDRETPEGRFWRKFKLPVVQKLLATPTHMEFNPVAPHDLAVTVGSRMTLFDYASSREKRSITKFKDIAYSASFRSDGKLMVAGGARPIIQVFDMSSRAVLRTFKGHAGPVHFTRFTADNTRVVSASDDRSLRIWDIPSNQEIATVEGAHDDYIRCGAVSQSSPYLVATGSYDHTARLWDTRLLGISDSDQDSTAMLDNDDEDEADDKEGEEADDTGSSDGSDSDEDSKDSGADAKADSTSNAGAGRDSASTSLPRGAILSVTHGEPVTQVLLLPGGGTMLTAGSNFVKLWDIVGGGKLIHTFSHHSKLITAVCLDGSGTRLLTAGLDSLVKVHELSTFSVTHTMRYDAPITCMAVSPDNSRMVVGCTNNSMTLKQRIIKVSEIVSEKKAASALRGGTYRYFLRGQSSTASVEDIMVTKGKKPKLRAYDKFLKTFEYGAALDSALASHDPIVVSSVLRELIARDGLHTSLVGRTEDSLEPVLLFLVKYIVDPRFSTLLLDVTNVVIDMYTQFLGTSAAVDTLFVKLHNAVIKEVKVGKDLLGLQGALDLLMAASTTGDAPSHGLES